MRVITRPSRLVGRLTSDGAPPTFGSDCRRGANSVHLCFARGLGPSTWSSAYSTMNDTSLSRVERGGIRCPSPRPLARGTAAMRRSATPPRVSLLFVENDKDSVDCHGSRKTHTAHGASVGLCESAHVSSSKKHNVLSPAIRVCSAYSGAWYTSSRTKEVCMPSPSRPSTPVWLSAMSTTQVIRSSVAALVPHTRRQRTRARLRRACPPASAAAGEPRGVAGLVSRGRIMGEGACTFPHTMARRPEVLEPLRASDSTESAAQSAARPHVRSVGAAL